MSFRDAALLLAWIVLVLFGFLLAALVQQVSVLRGRAGMTARMDGTTSVALGPLPGSRLPEPIATSGHQIVVFISGACDWCRVAVDMVVSTARQPESAGTDFTVVTGDATPMPTGGGIRVLLNRRDLFAESAVRATPLVTIAEDGVVRSSSLQGDRKAFQRLLDRELTNGRALR